jgi:hypothetical protein
MGEHDPGKLAEALRTASRALAIIDSTTDPDNASISTVLYVVVCGGRDHA